MKQHIASLSIALAAIGLPFHTHAIEEPAYDVLRTLDDVEVRQYAPYVVAEVLIEADADEAGNLAFPILAGYIFGKNKGKQELAMTAPVTQSAAPVKLEMTAPVTQTAVPASAASSPSAGSPATYRVQFVLPREVTLETAPEPIDPRVTVRQVAASRVAVIRYSGTWSQANYDEHLLRLKATLATANLATTGEPVFSRYNPPFMPWFLRRNEIWLALP